MATRALHHTVALLPDTLLHQRYLVERMIGTPGSSGVTYFAYDQIGNRSVAIREFLPSTLASRSSDRTTVVPRGGEHDAAFQDALARFVADAERLMRVAHLNVVRVSGMFRDNDTAYLVLDGYEGVPLEEHVMRAGGRLRWKAASQLVLRLLDGLVAVHAAGLVHGDVSMSNVLFTAGGRPVLANFGGLLERHDGEEPGPATDVYDAAGLLYRLVTGQSATDFADEVALSDEECPPGLRATIATGLARDPRHRPPDAQSYQRLLKAALGQNPLSMTLTRPPETVPSDWSMTKSGTFSAPTAPVARTRLPVEKIITVAIILLVVAVGVWSLLGR
ncbi:MAG TPA: serine/threonine-protein kinase [Gemmatimonadaceae bacterium]|nr:serine/threonine-protein kinase [Gemmatimonadaceae bacterium]